MMQTSGPRSAPVAFQRDACARVQGEHDRPVGRRHRAQQRRPLGDRRRRAVLGAMDRREEIAPRDQAGLPWPAGRATRHGVATSGSDAGGEVLHQVTDEDDAVVHTLGRQVGHGRRRRCEQPARQMVGDDAVDLLRHGRGRRSAGRPPRAPQECPVLAAASAPASVEFVSPTTSTASGRSAARIGSRATQHAPGLVGPAATADAQTCGPASEARAPRRSRRPSPRPSAGRCRSRISLVACAQRRLERRQLDQLRPRPDDGRDAHGGCRPLRSLPRGGRCRRRGRREGATFGLDADAVVRDAVRERQPAQRVAAVEEQGQVREPATKSRSRNSGSAGLGDDRPRVRRLAPAPGRRAAVRDLVGRQERVVRGDDGAVKLRAARSAAARASTPVRGRPRGR